MQSRGRRPSSAQVIFDEVPIGNYFVGGAPLQGKQIFVNGQIRAGRSALDLQRLLKDLVVGRDGRLGPF